MWHAFYDGNPLLFLPLVAMGGFMIAFTLATVRAWRRTRPGDASLPFDDGSAR